MELVEGFKYLGAGLAVIGVIGAGLGIGNIFAAFITDQQLIHPLRRVPVNLMKPLLNVVERLHHRHVVDYDDAMRAAAIAAGDRPEAFLPRRVPDLQLDRLALQLDRPDFL